MQYENIHHALKEGRPHEAFVLLQQVFLSAYRASGAQGIPDDRVVFFFHPQDSTLCLLRGFCLIHIAREAIAARNLVLWGNCYRVLREATPIDTSNATQQSFWEAICALESPWVYARGLVNQARELGKQKPVEAYGYIAPILEAQLVDSFTKSTVEWTMYWYIKEMIRRQQFQIARDVLTQYVHLTGHSPSLCHSLVLRQAFDAYDSSRDLFPYFLESWGIRNFREEDWQKTTFKSSDGKKRESPAIADKALKWVLDAATKSHPALFIEPLVERAIERKEVYIWLVWAYATYLVRQERYEEAQQLFKRLYPQKGEMFFYWAAFAEAYPNDADIQTGMLLIALQKHTEEKFLVKVLERLVALLKETGETKAAAEQFQRLVRIRTQEGKAISSAALEANSELVHMQGIRGATKSIESPYIEKASRAALGDSSFADCTLVAKWISKKGKAHVTLLDTRGVKHTLPERPYSILKTCQLGDVLEICVIVIDEDDRLKPIDIHLSKKPRFSLLERSECCVTKVDEEKGWAFFSCPNGIVGRITRAEWNGCVPIAKRDYRVFYYMSEDMKGNLRATGLHLEPLDKAKGEEVL